MAYTPQTWIEGSTETPLSAARLAVIETGIDDADTRLALGTGAIPQTITYAATITPDASAGSLFRCTATGDLTLNDPTNGVDGQVIRVEVTASGATRTLAFSGGALPPVPVADGATAVAVLYRSGSDWLVSSG